MPETKIESMVTTDIQNAKPEFNVGLETTDGVEAQSRETWWTNDKYPMYLAYYKKIPELKSKIDTYASWTIGKGFLADPSTELILGNIRGNGKQTFNMILESMIRTRKYGGDAYAEIILEDGKLINLKQLDPAGMRHIINAKGMLTRFEQTTKLGNKAGKEGIREFDIEDIFYLPNDVIADEIHGTSIIEAIEPLLKARNEALADTRLLYHRNLFPIKVWEVDFDDPARISTYKTMIDKAVSTHENIIVPKGTVMPPVVAGTAPNATLNPLPWIESLGRYISQATRVPDIVNGSSLSLTEAAAKIDYLVWQQTIEDEQTYIQDQVLAQLNLEIDLRFPASLQNEALSEEAPRDETEGVNPPEIQQNEQAIEPDNQTAELEG